MQPNAKAVRWPPLLRALRPSQWTKNAVVLAAYFFARWDAGQQAQVVGWRPLLAALEAAALFCLASSAVYLVNDVCDVEADRAHPQKRLRPVAAGTLSPAAALGAAALLLAVSLAGAWRVRPAFTGLLAAYLALQGAYMLGLKRLAFVDVFVIAGGFVLRATAGALALDVRLSPWLLLCTFLLALFLALCKRRHEKLLLEGDEAKHRAALGGYDRRTLDQALAITGGATIVCYAMYTLSRETVERFGTDRLGLTIPFVVFGILRYLDLVYRRDEGGRPEKVLLTDRVLLATVLLYGLTALAVFFTAGA
jgi:4-hydroxybenzoate polyprenyltransferase